MCTPSSAGADWEPSSSARWSRTAPNTGLKWILHTTDAHSLCEQFGFGRPDEKVMERLP
ncbi:MAG TPA: hypothetical protein VFG85_06715 [Gaiellaceae bacterium]|nr:hypothetical protein [Gaiellaceae bacterium]